MQIVVKATPESAKQAKAILAARVAAGMSPEHAPDVTVDPVFPGVTQGNRARMFTVTLPDDVPKRVLSLLLKQLQRDKAFEYAAIAAEKRPLGGVAGREG
jgi:hypothetical protein